MTDKQLTAWGNRYGITLAQVKRLRTLTNLYAIEREHYCNGDKHNESENPADKNENARLWQRDSEKTGKILLRNALRYGFDSVDFGIGLYPSFAKGNETCIHVPE